MRNDDDKKGLNQVSNATAFGLSGVNFSNCNHTTTCEDYFAVIQISVRDDNIIPSKAKGEWSGTTWNIGAQYRPNDDVMIYGRLSTGYRPGGSKGSFSLMEGADDFWFEAEQMTNYELGAKGPLFR